MLSFFLMIIKQKAVKQIICLTHVHICNASLQSNTDIMNSFTMNLWLSLLRILMVSEETFLCCKMIYDLMNLD